MSTVDLPELPDDPEGVCTVDCGEDVASGGRITKEEDGYSADQMRAYATEAVLRDRENRGEEGSIYVTPKERAEIQAAQNKVARERLDSFPIDAVMRALKE